MESRSYGECRCCLAKGNHRDITKEYYQNGIREVFIEHFMECFNLFLSTNVQLTSLICSSCVTQLQDACRFRNLVVSTERKLLQALSGGERKDTVFVNVAVEETDICADLDVKIEQDGDIKDEPVEEPYGITIDPGDDHDSDLDIKASSDEDILVEGEAELLGRFRRGSLAPLPTRRSLVDSCPEYVKHLELLKGESSNNNELCAVRAENQLLSRFPRETLKLLPTRRDLYKICPNYVRQLKLLQDVIVTPSTIKKIVSKKSYYDKTYITTKLGQVLNTNTILEFSNVTPFKSRARAGFSCFYCAAMLESLSMLREHCLEHNKSNIRKILKSYIPDRLVINVDVTDLKCSLCNQSIPNINTLKAHLSAVHNKILYQEFTDRVIPFKLNSNNMYECQVCSCNFETFGAVERHMNVHYRNYVCSQCGMGFVTQNRLKVHMYNTHVHGKFPCEDCKKVFLTKQKYTTHVNVIHKMVKRFRCIKCSERFTEYFHRQKHMSEVHGVAIVQYRCNVCEKFFERRYALSRHMKRDHLEERDHHCTLCSYTCFTSNELGLHMVKHSGEKKFECFICKKSYARKKTLREHLKIHNNERRFRCAICGQAFVQKCSLKGHMRTHHMGYDDME